MNKIFADTFERSGTSNISYNIYIQLEFKNIQEQVISVIMYIVKIQNCPIISDKHKNYKITRQIF